MKHNLKTTKRNLKWFISKIGKEVYRKDCKNVPLKINNKTHAKYLEMVQNDLNLEYSDKKYKQ